MADQRYYNMNSKGEDNRYKVNTNILRMMQANPALGTGYIIGSMLGENYWGRKRAKTRQETRDKFFGNQSGSVGADANGTYGTSKEPNYYDNMNKALEEYKNTPNGNVLYSGSGNNSSNSNPGVYIDTAKGIYPQTPQQANKPAVTTENAGSGGGVPGVMDAWNNMNNASMYNAGNTAMYTNGARNLGNVIGADANGVYGVPNGGSAPSAANIPRSPQTKAPNPNPTPIPYTPEQLAQIQAYGKFTPEELKRMGAGELVAPPVQAIPVAAPAQAPAPLETPTPDASTYAPSPISETDDHAPYYANPLSESDDHGQGEEAAIGVLQNAVNNFSRPNATRAGAADFENAYQPAGGSGAPRLQWDDPSLPFWSRKLVFK